ncbi:MAG: hypothetical protein U9P90_02440 [Patescibacteria group bacterium]|nr:hypothetical protein [Patescibacteria group bacterium]
MKIVSREEEISQLQREMLNLSNRKVQLLLDFQKIVSEGRIKPCGEIECERQKIKKREAEIREEMRGLREFDRYDKEDVIFA